VEQHRTASCPPVVTRWRATGLATNTIFKETSNACRRPQVGASSGFATTRTSVTGLRWEIDIEAWIPATLSGTGQRNPVSLRSERGTRLRTPPQVGERARVMQRPNGKLTPVGNSSVAALYRQAANNDTSSYPALVDLIRAAASVATWQARRRMNLIDWTLAADPFRELNDLLAQRRLKVGPCAIRKDISMLKWHVSKQLPGPEGLSVLQALDDLQAGARRIETRTPEEKALPLTAEILRKLIHGQTPSVRSLALMAFRTASRVGDLMAIGPDHVRHTTSSALLVVFTFTKTNPNATARPDHQVEIVGATELMQLLPLLKPKMRLVGTTKLLTFWGQEHARRLTSILKAAKVSPEYRARWQSLRPENPVRDHFTMHSIKRGAAHELWTAAAQGLITPDAVMHLLKHKQIDVSIDYAPDKLLVTRALGTSKATQYTQL
jgi:hypothetical protein